ncbi:MAG: glycoside hydrolase family 26 protein [Chloroflexota bacterium]
MTDSPRRTMSSVIAAIFVIAISLPLNLDAAGPPTGTSVGAQAPFLGVEPGFTSMMLGVYRPPLPNDLREVDVYESLAERRLAILHWYALWGGWKSDFNLRDLELTAERGSIPLISWEPWSGLPYDPQWTLRESILSGRNDDYIESWARGLAQYGKPVLLRFAHEMHGSSFPWSTGVNGNSVDDYVMSWQRVRVIFSRYETKNVQWVWNPNSIGDTAPHVYEPIYQSLYPGDDAVDWVGLDIYDTGPELDWGAPYWRSLPEILDGSYQALTPITCKPIILAEVGSATIGDDKAAWIRDGLGSQLPQRFPRVRAVVWFDVIKERPWIIQTSHAAYSAFIEVWREPHFE